MAGLRGEGPIVSVELLVVHDGDYPSPPGSDASVTSTASSLAPPASEGGRAMRAPRVGPVIYEDDVAFSPPRGMSMLCTWGICRSVQLDMPYRQIFSCC